MSRIRRRLSHGQFSFVFPVRLRREKRRPLRAALKRQEIIQHFEAGAKLKHDGSTRVAVWSRAAQLALHMATTSNRVCVLSLLLMKRAQ